MIVIHELHHWIYLSSNLPTKLFHANALLKKHAGECKSNDGPMNQVYPYRIHEPIADHQRPGDISCKPRI